MIFGAKGQIFGMEPHTGDHKPSVLLPESLTLVGSTRQTL
jgi:hypothetical protein